MKKQIYEILDEWSVINPTENDIYYAMIEIRRREIIEVYSSEPR